MTNPNPLLDSFSRLMTDAMGVAQGVKKEADTVFRSQMERFLRDLDVVSREEFDVVKDMVIAARDENERLAARIAELEERLG
jgi:BMFP domain-containing protein YqiC